MKVELNMKIRTEKIICPNGEVVEVNVCDECGQPVNMKDKGREVFTAAVHATGVDN
jgi:hypothetical protein